MTSWSDLGGDPCPGDVWSLRAEVDRLRAVADAGESVRNRWQHLLTGLDGLQWTGQAAETVHGRCQMALPDLVGFTTSHRDAQTALTSYVTQLERFKTQAQQLLEATDSAIRDRQAAQAALDSAHLRVNDLARLVNSSTVQVRVLQAQLLQVKCIGDTQAVATVQLRLNQVVRSRAQYQASFAQAQSDERGAQTRFDGAEQRRMTVYHQAEQLRDECRDEARKTSVAVLGAAGLSPGALSILREGFAHLVSRAQHFVNSEDFAVILDKLDEISALLGVAAVVLAVASAVFPPAAEVLLPAAALLKGVSLTLTGVAFIGRSLRAANGVGKWSDVAWDGFALATAGLGAGIGALSKSERVVQGAKTLGVVKAVDRYGLLAKAGEVKRVLAYDNTTKLSGLPRQLLQHVQVAPQLEHLTPVAAKYALSFKVAVDSIESGHKFVGDVEMVRKAADWLAVSEAENSTLPQTDPTLVCTVGIPLQHGPVQPPAPQQHTPQPAPTVAPEFVSPRP